MDIDQSGFHEDPTKDWKRFGSEEVSDLVDMIAVTDAVENKVFVAGLRELNGFQMLCEEALCEEDGRDLNELRS